MRRHVKVCSSWSATPEKYGLRISGKRSTLVGDDAVRSLRLVRPGKTRGATGGHRMRLVADVQPHTRAHLTAFPRLLPMQDVAEAPSFLVKQRVPRKPEESLQGPNPLVRPLPARQIRE